MCIGIATCILDILLCISVHTQCLLIETLDRTVGGKRHAVEVELSLTPLDPSQKGETATSPLEISLDIDDTSIKASGYSREELLSAIKSGVETACVQGIAYSSTHNIHPFTIVYRVTCRACYTQYDTIWCFCCIHVASYTCS